MPRKTVFTLLALFLSSVSGAAAAPSHGVFIPMEKKARVQKSERNYTCQIVENRGQLTAARNLLASLPEGEVHVVYLSAGQNDLALVPVNGQTLIFANTLAADGAKYVANQYRWWTKGDDVLFETGMEDDASVTCHAVSDR